MNLSGLRNRESASVWLCQIAKNTYFARYNEDKRHEPLDEADLIPEEYDIETAFARKEQSEKAILLLHELEEPYKEVFMLSVFGGLSLKEISKIFGKSESWARVTFYRARLKLSEKMR